LLRPVRPWLYPTYRRWQIATGRVVPTVDESLARAKLKRSPIRPLRRDEFQAMAEANPYYQRRWGYTSHALLEAVRLIARDRLTSALELGAPVRPVIVGAHVMDYRPRDEFETGPPLTIHDATVVPWPFADKAFDLFVALQVFEHLGDRQREAFLEVRRIARHAIVSLPIDWIMDDPTDSHHMISEARALSWFAPLVPSRTVEHLTGRRKRLIFVFEDMPLP
jgi:hypothetical protein